MAKYKAYSEYKDSGVEWLGEIPVHWSLKKAKYIFQKIQRPPRHIDGVVTAFRDGQVTLRTNRRIDGFTNSVKEIGYQGVRNGDLMIHAMDGFAGAIGISDSDGKCSPVNSVCIPWKKQPVNIHFYGYLVRQLAVTDFILSLAKGIRERSTEFRFSEFSALFLAIPSKDEQDKIVVFLKHETKKIDNLIDKQQQLIELLKEKRQAVISHAVTKGLHPDVPMKDSGVKWLEEIPSHWKMKRLAYLGSARNGLTYSPENITDQESGVLVLRSSNIQNLNLCFDDNVYVNINIPEQFLVKENDLIICSRNGSRNLIGKNALINKDSEGMAFGAFMAIFRSQINRYIFWVLNSPLFDYQSGSFLTSTINQLTIGNLKSMEVPIPPLKEQKQIELYLSEINNKFIELINKIDNSITLLQERRTALISAAVTGKIDVRHWHAPNEQSQTTAETEAAV
ncbi:restriction endonuclease subunit S [Citrobacter amalonaticus]|nr:restriction endonuclease subunit S [Citrobacter amalonaticus]